MFTLPFTSYKTVQLKSEIGLLQKKETKPQTPELLTQLHVVTRHV